MGGKSSKRGRKGRTPRAKTRKTGTRKVKMKSWGDFDGEAAGE